MSISPRVPPRFVPTLTEVVHVPDVLPIPVLPLQPAPSHQVDTAAAAVPVRLAGEEGADFVATTPAQRSASPQGLEECMVHHVMQRVDVMLDQRLRDAIALVVQEQTRTLMPRLREEIESVVDSVVRSAVYEAVADELASGNPLWPQR